MKKESIRMLRDLLLIRKIEQKPVTSGGIFLPSIEENDEPKFWEVIEVGKKVNDVVAGDKIVTHGHTMGQPHVHNGDRCMIIRWQNVFGVFEGELSEAAVY